MKRLTHFGLLIIAMQAAACADQAGPNRNPNHLSSKRCDTKRQLESEQAIRDVLTHNLFSFVDNAITVDRPVERFDEDGSYRIVRARLSAPTIGDYSISDGIITIRSPQAYFNLTSRRILVKGASGEIIFCDGETGLQLPLIAVAR